MPASRNLSTGKPLSVTTPRQKAVAIPLQNQNKQPRSLDDDEEASYQYKAILAHRTAKGQVELQMHWNTGEKTWTNAINVDPVEVDEFLLKTRCGFLKDNKGIKHGWVCPTENCPDCKVAQRHEHLPLHLRIFVIVDEGDLEAPARRMQQDIVDNYQSFPTRLIACKIVKIGSDQLDSSPSEVAEIIASVSNDFDMTNVKVTIDVLLHTTTKGHVEIVEGQIFTDFYSLLAWVIPSSTSPIVPGLAINIVSCHAEAAMAQIMQYHREVAPNAFITVVGACDRKRGIFPIAVWNSHLLQVTDMHLHQNKSLDIAWQTTCQRQRDSSLFVYVLSKSDSVVYGHAPYCQRSIKDGKMHKLARRNGQSTEGNLVYKCKRHANSEEVTLPDHIGAYKALSSGSAL